MATTQQAHERRLGMTGERSGLGRRAAEGGVADEVGAGPGPDAAHPGCGAEHAEQLDRATRGWAGRAHRDQPTRPAGRPSHHRTGGTAGRCPPLAGRQTAEPVGTLGRLPGRRSRTFRSPRYPTAQAESRRRLPPAMELRRSPSPPPTGRSGSGSPRTSHPCRPSSCRSPSRSAPS